MIMVFLILFTFKQQNMLWLYFFFYITFCFSKINSSLSLSLSLALFFSLKYNPAIPLLGIYPEKTMIQKDTCTLMFTAALFTTARTWKQPKCPSIEEWIKKMWYIYTMEYYSAIKKNEIGSFVETWMDLETVIQTEVSQKRKTNIVY